MTLPPIAARVFRWTALMGLTLTASAADRGAADVESRVDRRLPAWLDLYRHFHQNPELSFAEEKTAARLASELKQYGMDVTTGVGGHGIVGVLRNGAGPTVLIRTDLDALPVMEQTGLPYASRVRTKDDKGNDVSVMHACGHDLHMTVFNGVAATMSEMKDRWKGTLVFVGQPAEERGSGARKMLQDGLFARFPKPDFCLALHTAANLPAGSIGFVEGFAMANVDSVNLTVRGVGGHGAWPQSTRDPIVLASQMVMAFQTIVSRETEPGQAAVVTVGSIHAGTKHNIIPEEAKLQLTLRSYTDAVRSNTIASLERISKNMALAAGIPADRLPELHLMNEEFTPALYNDPELTRRVRLAVGKAIGTNRVSSARPVMGGEDFSEFGRTADKIPICLFWLGSVNALRFAEAQSSGTPLPSLHSSGFAPDPGPAIRSGVIAMTHAVWALSGRE